MSLFNRVNNITGWAIFLVASYVYVSTIEPTASWWDCGEYISASYKLMVGHEPGAPMFQMIARVFALFAGDDVTQVARWVNTMSALCSAFTILFLFWSITHFGRRIYLKDGKEGDMGSILAVMGAGAVGALAYTFSDSFWFSAVEGEVYAMSSMFTAMVFWAMLKWENVADEPHADRWIVLIALLMGMSIGVHLLNLLVIPVMTFVYYFRKYEATRNGMFMTLLVSGIIIVAVQYGIIPGVAWMASEFELVFVNSFGLPFNSGFLVFLALLTAGIVGGLWFTRSRGMVTANTVLLCVTVIMIGYSCYGLTVIRSLANPPMDESNPDNAFALHSYLNREQYGDRPLLMGHYFNAEVTDHKDGSMMYYKGEKKYEEAGRKTIPVYDPKMSGFLPRMYSNQPQHEEEYRHWSGAKGGKVKPSFGENMTFLFKYQLGFMYWRYFMWNFAGRQNDIQSHGEMNHGNWISGIKPLDEARLGPQSDLPINLATNKAHNRFFLLPLLLGIIGLSYQYLRDRQGAFLVGFLFFITGIAIVLYLNQYPIQPRERDYAYVGSFYAFAFWIGLGVLSVFDAITKVAPRTVSAVAATLMCLIVPGVMAKEGWDDHDRSDRYAARDIAVNYLESCAPNAILFTNGDNDTFPLWYAQEVEGVRTDVRVVNLSLFNTGWYIDQMRRQAYDAAPLPFSIKSEQLQGDNRLQIPVAQDYYEQQFQVTLGDKAVELKRLMAFVSNDDPRYKLQTRIGDFSYLPTRNIKLTVDSAQVLKTGTIAVADTGRLVKEMVWRLPSSTITRNHLMVLDILANNNWERPVYFAVTVGGDNYLGLEKYFQVDGLAYRLVPLEKADRDGRTGDVNTEAMYTNMVEKFKWGNMHRPDVYHGTESMRMSLNYRSMFARLATVLLSKGQKEKALRTADHCLEIMPHESIPQSFASLGLVEVYYKTGEFEKGNKLARQIMEVYLDDLRYYSQFKGKDANSVEQDLRISNSVLVSMLRYAEEYKQDDLKKELESAMDQYMQDAL
jgi:tetratricopeptide (TPR) repeat protein